MPSEAAWQAELWRRLRERLGTPSPAERLGPACERLRADPSLVDLPERISLFGLTRLPTGHLDVLRALAAGRDVHVFLLHPSPALWEKLDGTGRRSSGGTRTAPRPFPGTGCSPPGGRTRARCSSCSGRTSTSATTTRSRRAATRCSAASRPTSAPTAPHPACRCPGFPTPARSSTPRDRSVQIHACHGRARQVEVLRDAILHLLERGRHAAAARRDRDVPGHRDVRAADPGNLRRRRGRRGRRTRATPRRVAADRPARPPRRPLAAPDQSGARRGRPVAGPCREPHDRLGRARPRRPRARAPALPLRGRGPCAHPRLGRRERYPLGPRRCASRPIQARDLDCRDLEARAGPRPRRRDDDGGGAPAVRGRAAGRRRREPRHRPRGANGRARRPRAGRGRRLRHGHARRRVGPGHRDRRRRPHRDLAARRMAASAAGADPRRRRERGSRQRQRRTHAARGPGAAGRAAAGSPDTRELPDRPSHDLHPRPDALCAAPGRVPARPRRHGVPSQGPARRRRHHAQRPARRGARPSHRGPPDAARCPDGSDRPPDRHVRRQRRAHERAASACRPGWRAARRHRPQRAGRCARAGARQAPTPGLRPAQLHARRTRRRRPVELQPRHARRSAGDGGGARSAAAVPRQARSRP